MLPMFGESNIMGVVLEGEDEVKLKLPLPGQLQECLASLVMPPRLGSSRSDTAAGATTYWRLCLHIGCCGDIANVLVSYVNVFGSTMILGILIICKSSYTITVQLREA